MSVKKFIVGVIVLVIATIVSTTAQAVPSLGVAAGSYDGAACTGNYFSCFSGTYGTDGWILGDGTITVFTNISDADIWLLTTSAGAFADGAPLNVAITDSGQFDGYTPASYYGINLGEVDGDWAALNNAVMKPPDFSGLELTLSGSLETGQWFFAVADDNNLAGLQANGGRGSGGPDSFSPKTTSTQVPEPGTLLLLGGGLLGLGFFGRKKFRK